MYKNKIKIVSNERTSDLAFFFKNEREVWEPVSVANELSRKKYAKAIQENKIEDVLKLILECFNNGNRGVEILFEGNNEDFDAISNCVINGKFNDEITITKIETKIAVCGKTNSGKSVLIEELSKILNFDMTRKCHDGFEEYSNSYNRTKFYEIMGIDYTTNAIEITKTTAVELLKNGITVFLYCISAGKIEDAELEFLHYLKENFPSVSVCIVMTKCFEHNSSLIVEEIRDVSGFTTLPVLARNKKIRNGIEIESFGLSDIIDYIYEG